MSSGSRFSSGDPVRRIASPDQVGIVREVWRSDQTEQWLCRVQFGTQRQTVPESALEGLPDSTDPWRDLAEGRIADPEAYAQLLTFERIHRPASRVAASFGTAKAKLLPYQFKPLLKFLENANQRILIADDVGLGKTVEAGYIYKELRARHGIERCLIVVPARLRTKWRNELQNRFDETFEIVNAKTIDERLLNNLRSNSEPDKILWITSYESLRQPRIVGGLAKLQPSFDLVVLDEAHRVRNPETEQHRAARVLSDCADAMVLLSATPVQTKLENLFQLLALLEPNTFTDFGTFQKQLQANEPVVRALRLVRRGGRALEEAADELETLGNHPLTTGLTKEDFFIALLDRLRAGVDDRASLVALQRDVSELSITSQFISRTRKADVLPDKADRVPQSPRIELTDAERRFYLSVAMLFLNPKVSSSWGNSMALLTALRLTASCIPAAARYFEAKGLIGLVDTTNCDEGAEDPDAHPLAAGSVWDVLTGEVDAKAIRKPAIDSKFARFDQALKEIWAADQKEGREPRKVLVFAFFRGTLEYLSERLTGVGVSHRLIHGGVAQGDREVRIEEFINDSGIRVLLSSEVGSEGVDLQVASVVVNYDLPWNPMVVEQRIGRADRLGQQSKVITIVNLVLKDTVEERILLRLYERVDLFRNSIGELEPILGESLEDLAIAELRATLTPQEIERKVESEALALQHQLHEAARLQDDADQLLAGDQAFLDEVQGLVGFKKVPSPAELYRFLSSFLDLRYPGCKLPPTSLAKSAVAELRSEIAAHLLTKLGSDADVRRTASLIRQGSFPVTFDSDAYMSVGRSEFVSMHHPLIRLACADFEQAMGDPHRTFGIAVDSSEPLMPGNYVLAIIEMQVSGLRPRIEIVPLAIQVGAGDALGSDDACRLYASTLERGTSLAGHEIAMGPSLSDSITILKKLSELSMARLKETESTLGALRAARRRATQEGTLRHKVGAATDRVRNLRTSGAEAFALRMAEARAAKAQALLDAFLDASSPALQTEIQLRDIAVAFVKVGRA